MGSTHGFNGSREDVLRIWEKNSEGWFSVGSPWRPSAGDVRVYQKLCGSRINGRVLILGSTSELRELVASQHNSPVLVDISFAMLQKMSQSLTHGDQANEIWIKSDWCEAPLRSNYFDLIIGDMVWWVVSVDSQFRLRDKIADLLAPDGIFVSRFRLIGAGNGQHNPRGVVKEYLAKYEANPENEILLRNAMMSRLYDSTADVGTKRLNRERAKVILSEVSDGLDNSRHRAFLSAASERLLSADWTAQTREEIFSILADKFELFSEMHATDYESEYYPIVSFKKK